MKHYLKDTNGMVLFQDALAQLRGMSSGVSRVGESYETLQSRARELEKKVCVLIIIYYISLIVSLLFVFFFKFNKLKKNNY